MRYDGETADQGRAGSGATRLASKSVEILKAATALGGRIRPEDALQPDNDYALVAAPVATPAPVARPALTPGAGPSVMGLNAEITGTINTPTELHIYGKINGDVRAAAVTIFAGGQVTGEIAADAVTVHGTVEGRIEAKTVQLLAGGVVRGDVVHGSLVVDGAAIFEGLSKRA